MKISMKTYFFKEKLSKKIRFLRERKNLSFSPLNFVEKKVEFFKEKWEVFGMKKVEKIVRQTFWENQINRKIRQFCRGSSETGILTLEIGFFWLSSGLQHENLGISTWDFFVPFLPALEVHTSFDRDSGTLQESLKRFFESWILFLDKTSRLCW
jgi:hypothetical protein